MAELIEKCPSRPRRKLTPKQKEYTTKRRGELAELAFSYKATSLGLHVSKPYGDSERYDFIVDNGHKLWKVQIKSTTVLLNGLYHVNAHRRINGTAVAYKADEVDVLVAYIIPEDTWYILPLEVIQDRTSLLFAAVGHPRGPGLYAAYREAWHLFQH